MRRHRHQRHALHLRQLLVGLVAQLADGAGGLFLQVPFVDRDDDGAAFLLDQIGDALVLLLEGVLDVEQHDHDLGKAHRVERVGDRKLFQLLVDARAAAKAGGVVDAEFLPAPVEIDRDGVARDAGLRPGEQALLADQPVDQRRLAGVGPADNGDADRMRARTARPPPRCCGRRAFGQRRAQRVVEIGQAFVVLGGNRHRVAEAERIGVEPPASPAVPSILLAISTIGLPDLRTSSAKARSTRRRPGARVDHEEDRIGLRRSRSRSAPACGR